MGRSSVLMGRIIAFCQQAAMNFWVQGFYPPIHNLWKAGYLGYICYRQTSFAQGFSGAASREQGNAQPGKARGKFGQTAFV